MGDSSDELARMLLGGSNNYRPPNRLSSSSSNQQSVRFSQQTFDDDVDLLAQQLVGASQSHHRPQQQQQTFQQQTRHSNSNILNNNRMSNGHQQNGNQSFPLQSVESSFGVAAQSRNYQMPMGGSSNQMNHQQQRINEIMQQQQLRAGMVRPPPLQFQSLQSAGLQQQMQQQLQQQQQRMASKSYAMNQVPLMQSSNSQQQQSRKRNETEMMMSQQQPYQKKPKQANAPATLQSISQIMPPQSTPVAVDNISEMNAGDQQDAVQYAGVDLKAESQLLMKNAEQTSHSTRRNANNQKLTGKKPTTSIDLSGKQPQQEPLTMMEILKKTTHVYGLKKLNQDCDSVLTLALEAYLTQIVELAIKASYARLESNRDRYDLQVVDGDDCVEDLPESQHNTRSRVGAVKRSLAWLEKHERTLDLDLAMQLRGGLSQSGYDAWLACGGRLPSDEDSDAASDQAGGDGMEVSASTDNVNGGNAMSVDNKPISRRERVDQVISARNTNTAALQAAGMTSKYSWMTSGVGQQSSPVTATTSVANSQLNINASSAAVVVDPLAGFGLPRAALRKKLLEARRVEAADLEMVIKYAIGGYTLKRMRAGKLQFDRGKH